MDVLLIIIVSPIGRNLIYLGLVGKHVFVTDVPVVPICGIVRNMLLGLVQVMVRAVHGIL